VVSDEQKAKFKVTQIADYYRDWHFRQSSDKGNLFNSIQSILFSLQIHTKFIVLIFFIKNSAMKYLLFLLVMISMMSNAQQSVDFDHYFTNQTLRIDYFHTGDAKSEIYSLDKIYRRGTWAGNPAHLIQPFELGTYRVDVYDIASNTLIYTRGYSTIFSEYQTTGPAIDGIKKTSHESVLIPNPRKPIQLVIQKRDRQNILAPVFSQKIDPSDYHINTETVKRNGDVIIPAINSGDPQRCVDLVILGEGYKAGELQKFQNDLDKYVKLFFSIEPYKSRKKLFNVTGIFSPSEESGTDQPRERSYRNTAFGSSFNAFDLDRYCLDEDNKSIRNVAGEVPYDAVMIMVNIDRYGGGGIYNWQTVFCADAPYHDYVFLHEFGHAFAGLGDEYFTSPVAYQDFSTPGVEPLDPNITILLDTANVKWKQYLSPGIKVPTEWGKARFDSLINEIAVLKRGTAEDFKRLYPKGAAGTEMKINELNKELDDFMNNHPLKDKVGVFEGANYTSKGFYRPTLMSLMHKFSEHEMSYGIVNEQAIISAINFFTGN
jgi:hypothetical protein